MHCADTHNILTPLPSADLNESMETLVETGLVRIERIVSCGQATPEGEWYDQNMDEWVLLLSGCAELLIEQEAVPRRLTIGDYLMLPAGCRHRVTWTDPTQKTVWLAIHFAGEKHP